ncbi:ABC transporter ATP-binding protein [Pedobacter caeni]|uniref:ABC-2 type transport system ATP-binding protein n=1 Tax=Pedobacter caeni TaxID=288992 RepID=A0A1M4UGK3_9SPHI|nr:ABC transporter ATP-binding protein [Pedobacter caeni]SHE55795.1 ABC-2 type transport system ATP-binding protein [Pedobacter caeni]
MNVIETKSLVYDFGSKPVLNGIDLTVQKGSIFGFLGPNGSGKTTTIRALLGLARVPEKSVMLFGKDIRTHRIEILKNIGSLIEYPALYNHLSGYDNLHILCNLTSTPKKRIKELLDLVLLTDCSKKVSKYSLGMKQRLGIAAALLTDPELLILDEPTNGLDPAGIRDMRHLIKTLNQDFGKTIFISSHLLYEVEMMCSHLAILKEGKLVFQGRACELKNKYTKLLLVDTSDNKKSAELIEQQYPVKLTENLIEAVVKEEKDTAVISRILFRNDIDIYRLEPKSQNLEELFFNLTTND